MSSRIIVVEDHPLFADALMANLSVALPKARIEHASSLDVARNLVQSPPSLLLLDLNLPDACGFEALIEMRRLCPEVPILVVSAYCDETICERGLAFGASGFISKCAPGPAIIDASRRLLAGESLQPLAKNGSSRGANKSGDRLKSLTTQQLRVLQLVCQGLLNKQIAHHLAVSEATIKAHVGEILHKLGVSTRTQAVAEISRAGLAQTMAFDVGEPRMSESR